MLEISRGELKRRSKYVPIVFLVGLLILIPAVKLVHQSFNFGWLYSANVPVDDFTVSDDPDIVVGRGVVFVKDSLKSYAAFDRFREIVRNEYNEWIFQNYGEKAFPVLVRVHEIPTGLIATPKEYKPPKKQTTPKVIKRTPPPRVTEVKEIKKIKKEIKEIKIGRERKETERRVEYYLPENLRPPILFEKFVYAFAVLLPLYFISQVFSSSFMEDKVKGRIEVLLTVSSEQRYLAEKLLPYIVLISVLSISVAIFFKDPAVFPIVFSIGLLMISIDAFIVFLSRSYRELSFISVVVSIIITAYLLLPAIFSFIPSLSPVTLLMYCIKGEGAELSYLIPSTFHLILMAVILLLITSNSFEFMQSRSILGKVIDVTARMNDRYYKVLIFTALSIPFVLLIELFVVAVTFPLREYYLPVLVSLAIVEEFFKGLFIYTADMNDLNPYISAILSATGFFIGEKLVLFSYLPTALAGLFLIPLLAHIIFAITFALTMEFGFKRALIISSSLHATYNGLIVWMLLR